MEYGQNALLQAKMFHEAVGVTGIVLTKLDGTAKGGIVFAINKELAIPVKFVGIGEGIETCGSLTRKNSWTHCCKKLHHEH
jgi:signal recognition particle GTPase